MPLLSMLDNKPPADGAISDSTIAKPPTPFKLSQLDLGSIGSGKKTSAKKRAADTAIASDDDEDPREEAQMMQLLQQMQRVKQSKENRRKKGEISAKAKAVAAGVRRNASKRVDEVRTGQNKLATELRSTLGSLHAALEEEDHLASALMEEQERTMKEAVDSLSEKYEEAAKVQVQVKLLGDCMRQHFQVVRSHIADQVGSKLTETEGVVHAIHNQPDKTLSLIRRAGGLS
ncbi:unnamed protein product [Ectocarpus sp. 6 AP-2014]